MTFITIHINDYKLSNLCAALAVSRRTYYKYRGSEDPDYYEYLLIKDIFDGSKGTYGYRRIEEGLKIKYGVIFNHKKVARVMRKYNLKPEYVRRLVPNIGAKRIEENVRPNLVKRRFRTEGPNLIWCTDVTYLTFGNRRAYLSTIPQWRAGTESSKRRLCTTIISHLWSITSNWRRNGSPSTTRQD